MSDQTALSFAKDIRPMFTDLDVAHMEPLGYDLASKDDVAENADVIYAAVSSGRMPPPESGEPWSDEMCARFKAWQTQGCPP